MNWSEYKIKETEFGAKNYPNLLNTITKPPKQLYYRGEISKSIFKKSIAVVGSRRMTSYGKRSLESILPPIIDSGVTIISGFMYGVDTLAHNMAVEMKGKTVAVFGCGLNTCYPLENAKLYTKILQNKGVIFSEYKSDLKPKPWMYVQRNRIVSGLSTLGVLVVEADKGSGSLVTAKLAKQENKKIYALPGPIDSTNSQGTNILIKSGDAKLVTEASDILNISAVKIQKNEELKGLEGQIYKLIQREPLTTDEIALHLNKGIVEIMTCVTTLSMEGLVKEEAGRIIPLA